MSKSSLFQSVDQNLGGQLEATLVRMRDEGQSLDSMLRELGRAGVVVSRQTIANWLRSIPAAEPEAAS